MGQVVCDVAVTADGYLAGRDQNRENPFGDAPVERMFGWVFDTPDENRAGIDAALARARAAAGDRDVVVAGGAATVNQYLRAGHVDELRTHVVPVTIGAGDRLFEGVPGLDLEIVSARGTSLVTHITYRVHH